MAKCVECRNKGNGKKGLAVKIIFLVVIIVIIAYFGFSFTVREGTGAIVTSFGKVRSVYTDAGLHFKLPWPFEKVVTYDTRSQYLDSGYTETLTSDKKNVIMQTYIIWNIDDAEKFHKSLGDIDTADKYLNDLVANMKNGVMGNYQFSSLVSTAADNLKIDDISAEIEQKTQERAMENYGINIKSLKIKRLSLPYANIQSVLEQMIADRQKYADELLAQGDRDAALIISQANAEAKKIIADGKIEAAEINAETEKQVAAIYGDAYNENSELFIFLKKLIALENSVNEDTVLIIREDEAPFDIIDDLNDDGTDSTIGG